ncbi:MAG: hypothetical protein LBM96_05820 [Methanobrevibacter sp.]|jgi:hypothetical protein|nr:hypothetical protein [Candidatus Methanoflexus mossambicus]
MKKRNIKNVLNIFANGGYTTSIPYLQNNINSANYNFYDQYKNQYNPQTFQQKNTNQVFNNNQNSSSFKLDGAGAGMIGQAAVNTINTFREGLATNAEEINNKIDNTFVNTAASTNADVMNNFLNFQQLDKVSYDDVRGDGPNYLDSIGKGIAGGSTMGPWGALIGGAAGLLNAGIADLFGSQKAKRQQKELNAKIQKTNQINLNKLSNSAEQVDKMNDMNIFANYSAMGGPLNNMSNFSNGLTEFNSGGSHEQNPLGGIPQGISNENGLPNMVEEGEVKYKDYVYSDRLGVDKTLAEKYRINKKYVDHSFAKIAEMMNKESSERPYDNISNNALSKNLLSLQKAQEDLKAQEQMKIIKDQQKNQQGENQFDLGGFLNTLKDNFNTTDLRYAPIYGSGLSVLGDMFGYTNKNDFSDTDRLNDLASRLSTVTFSPIANYLNYKPIDQQQYINQINESNNATRNAIINNSNGNRSMANAALSATNLNHITKLSDLIGKLNQYEDTRKERVATFNRGTDQYNSQMGLETQKINKENDALRSNLLLQELQMRDAIKLRNDAAKSANLSNFYNNLGNLGKENFNRNMINAMQSFGYYIDKDGNIKFKRN